MIRKSPVKSSGPMNKAEATAITDRIREGIDGIWADLLHAYEGKAWKALGYSTWEAYVNAEFSMSRQRSYQLIDQGRVVHAIAEATGNLSTTVDISERETRDIKDDLPAVVEEIKAKVEAGEEPEKAVAETIAEQRAAKERAKADKVAQQAEFDRQRDEANAKLPAFVNERERAKADAIAARKAKPADVDALIAENEELREANAALEAEVAALKADNTRWEAMRVQFEQGGFDKVVAGKDEEIRVLLTRVETESRDKAQWAKSSKYWKTQARELGYAGNDIVIPLDDELEAIVG